MKSARRSLEHPIVFLVDVGDADVDIPELDVGAVVSSTSSCVSVRVVSEVDGDAALFMANHAPPVTEQLHRVFEGALRARSRVVSLVCAEREVILDLPIERDPAQLEIFVDDNDHPTKVWIAAK